jgi:ketosteroid isomerase-like protein
MKAFVTVILLLAAAAAGAHEATLTPAETEVRQLERAWLDAYENFDAEAMDRIVADDFTITFPEGGVQTKPELMKQIRAPREKDAPPMKFVTENVQSRAYGETVILMGVVVTLFERDGKPARAESRYTDTYVKVGGSWKVVASHLSRVPKPAEPPAGN